ncbi:MAG: hypothetical protein K1X39_09860 [Thermoflexales bacterium]|nr:hypothetical protein [Thermoflexales bacterium]
MKTGHRFAPILIVSALLLGACSRPTPPAPTPTPTPQLATATPLPPGDPTPAYLYARTPTPSVRIPGPKILEVGPKPLWDIGIGESISITFDQPMDRASVERAFVIDPDVMGRFVWSPESPAVGSAPETLVFRPDSPLHFGARYTATVRGDAASARGQRIGDDQVLPFWTATEFALKSFDVAPYRWLYGRTSFALSFSRAPITKEILSHLSLVDDLGASVPFTVEEQNRTTVRFTLQVAPMRQYSLTVRQGLPSIDGDMLSKSATFRFGAPELDPKDQSVDVFIRNLSEALLFAPGEAFQVRFPNLGSVARFELVSLSAAEFFSLTVKPGALGVAPRPPLKDWTISVPPESRLVLTAVLPLTGTQLATGYYALRTTLGAKPYTWLVPLAIVDRQVLIEHGKEDALVWVTDPTNGLPVSGAKVSVETKDVLGCDGLCGIDTPLFAFPHSDHTDGNGILKVDFGGEAYARRPVWAIVGKPGESGFGVGVTRWTLTDGEEASRKAAGPVRFYAYTDAAVYGPGQTIHFKAVLRPGSSTTLPRSIGWSIGKGKWPYVTGVLEVSPYGTVSGTLTAPKVTGQTQIPIIFHAADPGLVLGWVDVTVTDGTPLKPDRDEGRSYANLARSVDAFSVEPDRASYVAGETARIQITTPFTGVRRALVTAVGDRLLWEGVATLKDGRGTVEIPVGFDFAPGATVRVVAPSQTQSLLTGRAEIRVAAAGMRLEVSAPGLRGDYRAGEQVAIVLQTQREGRPVAAEVSVALVDATPVRGKDTAVRSILDGLYPVPNPVWLTAASTSARGTRPLGADIDFATPLISAAATEWPHPVPNVVAYNPVVVEGGSQYWNPAVFTDANGRATLTLPLPTRAGTWRLIIRAAGIDGSAGQAIFDVVTR